ncbi:photosystem II repair protein PSB27-H1, chloroplastic-like [Triticum dicoccoides]|uniref:photosystem II repair protein PSB27-H1, chloroplastic-like n=1 Tax=Triticum dicoccoides TaxID=85692 RepID=UPI00188F84D8|nr:photosystem II repair protein PSB27-H1, chloroplastic-like [Triticum dicoccoides]
MRSPVPAMLTAPSAAAAVAKALPVARSNTTAALHATASSRRDVMTGVGAALLLALSPQRARAASDDEYLTETTEVIGKVRSTISMDKTDPKVADAVTELREMSNSWVAKYRREKALLGRQSFRDMYSALNAVSGHYISFGPTAPIPNKRRIRILEEMDAVEKSLKRGR